MAEIYRMPAVTPTMEIGTIVEWRLEEGQAYEAGTAVVDVGTDKANMEAEVFEEGVLLKRLVEEGDEIPLNAPIAIIGDSADEDISALVSQAMAELDALKNGGAPAAAPEAPAAPAPAPETPAPAAAPAPASRPAPAVEVDGIDRTWHGKSLSLDFMDPPGDIGAASQAVRVLATPLAKKVAKDLGVDLTRVDGSGPRGRVRVEDVEAAAAKPTTTAGFDVPEDTLLRATPMRKTIARRLLESHQDIPTFFLTATFDMAGFVALRKQLKAQLPDVKISYNDILIAAVARALRESPMVNASWTDKGIMQHGRVDVGVAVALPEGLITPVLRSADRLRLSEIGGQVRELAGRAKDGKLSPEEYTGGTFTISNLGMFDIEHFTAIINPPESGILAVGSIAEVPIVENGALTTGWRMKVTMTCDHRVIDGAVGAAFLQVLRRYVETPALLLA